MFLYEFAEKTAQKPDTVATYVRRNKKIFKNHVERRQKQIWLDEKAVDILLKKYPEVQKKQKKPMTGIGIARRYWLFCYIDEPIYLSVYHVFGGGKTISYRLLFSLLVHILF